MLEEVADLNMLEKRAALFYGGQTDKTLYL
jgi:hypothetical protein